jgi:hypothetical protein
MSIKTKTTSAPPPDMLNRLILEYLEHSGRTKAARRFRHEADFNFNTLQNSIQERGAIRRKILSGDIIGAVEAINDFAPELLDGNPDLGFLLRLQAFVELVRVPGYDLESALAFAGEEFVPCPEHMLQNLEEVMALLAFENPAESPLKEILHRRENVAAKVNQAILLAQNYGSPELVSLISTAIWMDRYCGGRPTSLTSDTCTPEDDTDEFFEQFLQTK